MMADAPRLLAYPLGPDPPRLAPAARTRAWMDAYPGNSGYRCLPLNMANALGWALHCPVRVAAEWTGGPAVADLRVRCAREGFASSHFGNGVLTFQPGYLFVTEPGVNLWVRGPANAPKPGLTALEGLVETDWLAMGATMNWKCTAPGRVTFEADEVFCVIVPFPAGYLETFRPELRRLASDPEFAASLGAWTTRRRESLAAIRAGAAPDDPFHGAYMRGTTALGVRFGAHQTKLVLQPFREIPPETKETHHGLLQRTEDPHAAGPAGI